MEILRVRGKDFQGLKQFDITFPKGSACITGPNMSKKSTFARAIIWCVLGQFPHPDVTKWSNDYVVPDSSFSKTGTDGAKKKKKKGGDSSATVVETWFSMPAAEDDVKSIVYVCKRIYIKGKVYLTLRSENGDYDFQNKTQAQNIIFNLARIPSSLTYTKRVEVMTRLIWLGVGQETSIFHAKAADRKRILESTNPATKFSIWEQDSASEIKGHEKSVKELNKYLSELSGEASAKNEELLRKLSSFNVRDATKENVFAEAGEFLTKMRNQKVLPISEIEKSAEKLQRNILTLDSLAAAKVRLEQLQTDIQNIEKELILFKSDENINQKNLLDATLSELSAALESLNLIDEKKNHLKSLENKITMSENQVLNSIKSLDELDSSIIELSLHMEAALVLAMTFNENLEVPHVPISNDLRRSGTIFITDIARALGLPNRLDLSSFADGLANLKAQHEQLFSKTNEAEEERLAEINTSKEKLRTDVSEAKHLAIILKTSVAELTNISEKTILLVSELESLNELDAEVSKAFSVQTLLSKLFPSKHLDGKAPGFSKSLEQGSKSVFVQNLNLFGFSLDSELELIEAFFTNIKETLLGLVSKETALKDSIRSSLQKKENVSNELFSKRFEQKKTFDKLSVLRKSIVNANNASNFSCQECGVALDASHLEKHLNSTVASDSELLSEISVLESSLSAILAGISSLEIDCTSVSKEVLALNEELNLLHNSSDKYHSVVGEDKCNWINVKESEFKKISDSLEKLIAFKKEQEDSNLKNQQGFNEVSNSIKRFLSSVKGASTQEKIQLFETSLENESKEIRLSIEKAKESKRKSQESLRLVETSSLKFLAEIGFENFESSLFVILEDKKSELSQRKNKLEDLLLLDRNNAKILADKIEVEESALSSALGVGEDESPRGFIRQSSDLIKQEILAIDAALRQSQETKNAFISKSATISELKSSFPEDVWNLKEGEIKQRKQSIFENLKELSVQKELIVSLNDVERLYSDVKSLEQSIQSTSESIEDKEDEMRANSVIKSLLSQNGDCRTFALSQDISNIVRITNESLASLTLKHSLAVDLKLEKDESQAPTIEILFEVDGSSSSKTLPSESQRKIVGICMDLALRELSMYSGFIFIDEPETGLDEINKGKFSQFLKGASPQTIVITNLASAGFENKISTDMITNSVSGTLSDEDFNVDEIVSLARETASKDGDDDVEVYKIDRSSGGGVQTNLDDDFEDSGDI